MRHLGFDWQRAGTCSRFALRHALLCIGVPTTERELSRSMARSRLRTAILGSEESAIIKAVRHYGATPRVVWERKASTMREALDRLLGRGAPCIVCVDDQKGRGWAHWAVLAGKSGSQYFWIDSDDGNLIGSWSTKQVLDWMHCDGEATPYYAIAVRPGRGLQRSRSIVGHFAEAAELLDQGNLHETWGERLAQLGTVFTVASGGHSARKFFAQAGRTIVQAVASRKGEAALPAITASLDAYAAVATTHRLRVGERRLDLARRKLDYLVAREVG